jgi:hypothetical protein
MLLLLLALFFRAWDLVDLPTGISDAEINTIRLTETVRRGNVSILLQDAQGRGQEMLVPTVLAIVTGFVGNGTLGFRQVTMWVGLITLALAYSLGVRLYGRVAGLCALGVLAVTFWPVLLAREVLVESFLPLLVTTAMLSLARAIPVYRVARQESATTAAFATLGFVVGVGFYVHPMGLLLAMATMIFIVYILIVRRSSERQRFSYIGFSILIVLILTIPYLVFNINRPELAAGARLVGDYQGIFRSVGAGLGAVFLQGDANPARNLPHRPLFDVVTAVLMFFGLVMTLRSARYPRYMLLLVFFVVLSPAVLLQSAMPNFSGFSIWLVPLALFFGVGVYAVYSRVSLRARGLVWLGLIALLAGNVVWTGHDLFTTWRRDPAVQQAMHADLQLLARYLDRTMGSIPTVICYPQVSQGAASAATLNNTRKMFLMMNRKRLENVRLVDCNTAMIFTQGGARQQVIFVEPNGFRTMHPYLQRWASMGMFLTGSSVPPERVSILTVETELANRLGAFTTTDPANYGFETPQTPQQTIYPPIRFGGNITWMGYEPDSNRRYRAGETVSVINFWRVESGPVPGDLIFFTHILSDPVTVADNRDMISLDVSYLRERDILVQVTPIDLRSTLLTGRYQVSIGAYQEQTGARLPVFDANQVRQGDRLILYPIEIVE